MERVLKPGGIGAFILAFDGSAHDSLIGSAMPVSPFLKSSSVVHVASLNAKNILVAFKKNFDHRNISILAEHLLPFDCPSLRRNRPYIDCMEPNVEARSVDLSGTKFAYLLVFVSVTGNMRLVYVDMGKREAANFNDSNWFLPSYPLDSRAINVYIVDHNALIMSSHVQKPGINLIYYLRLSKNLAAADANASANEEFDFLAWFKKTVSYSDLVVLKMSAGRAELKFLQELFESGAICSVDELFLECSDAGGQEVKLGESCMDLLKNLRSTGVFVHQWW